MSFVALIVLFSILTSCMQISSASFVNRTYIFLSGSPQSGTSLLHNFMEATPGVTSMHAGCSVLYGASACSRFNHEGQWMLPRNELVSKWFRPGRMCRIVDSPPQSEDLEALRGDIVGTWHQIWGNHSKLRVEKSPQSMLKVDLYAKLFHKELTAGHKLKFLIILKHPSTLNTAIMQDKELIMKYMDFNWLTYASNTRDSAASSSSKLRKVSKLKRVMYSDAMHMKNLWHFVHAMTRGEAAANRTSSSACVEDLGWLAAARSLVRELQDFENGESRAKILRHLHNVHIGFMRFEDLSRPVPACYALYKFVFFDSPDHYQAAIRSSVGSPGGLDDLLREYNDAAESVCGRLKGRLSPFDWGAEKTGTLRRRRLRLRGGLRAGDHPASGDGRLPSLAFDSNVMQHSVRARLREFAQLSSKAFYSAALGRLYGADSEYGSSRGFTTAQEEVSALETALAGIQTQLSLVSYSLKGPHFVKAPVGTLRSYSLMNTFGNASNSK